MPLGTTADRGSPCPIGVAPRGHEVHADGVRPVGAAFLPTAEGREMLEMARRARYAGARLEAVMVVNLRHAAAQSPGMMADAHHNRGAAEDNAPRDDLGAEDALREGLASSAADLGVESDVLFQDPADGLDAASERLDLLAIGSAAHGPAGAVALGAVARKASASAGCPVLVLPRDAASQIEALLPHTEPQAAQ